MVCFDTPSSRPTSAADRPASICFNAPIISTSLYFLLDMLPPLRELRYSYTPLRGFWGAGQIGLGPAANASSTDTLKGNPVPGAWEKNEKPGHNNGDVPDYSCDCVNQKANNPGNPPKYCTYKGNKETKPVLTCSNCAGWVLSVLQDCRNKAFQGHQ